MSAFQVFELHSITSFFHWLCVPTLSLHLTLLHCCLIGLEQATVTGDGPKWYQEQAGSCVSLTWGHRTLTSVLVFLVHQQGTELAVEQPDYEQAPIWHAGIVGTGVNCYAPACTPRDLCFSLPHVYPAPLPSSFSWEIVILLKRKLVFITFWILYVQHILMALSITV